MQDEQQVPQDAIETTEAGPEELRDLEGVETQDAGRVTGGASRDVPSGRDINHCEPRLVPEDLRAT